MRILVAILALAMAVQVPARADDASDRAEITQRVAAAIHSGKFSELERMARELSDNRRSGSGIIKTSMFDRAVSQALDPDGAPEHVIKQGVDLAARWAAENPSSPKAHTIYANTLIAYSGYFRGGGYANSVSPQAWSESRKHLEAAARHLIAHAPVASKDVAWHLSMIDLGRLMSWPQANVRAIARAALALSPGNERIHYFMVHYLFPRWQGDTAMLDDYINEAAATIPDGRGREIYARLYALGATDEYGHRMYTDSKVDWGKMKAGFADMLTRFPSKENVNLFAYNACIAGDKPLARKLIGEIGETPIIATWNPHGRRTYAQCRDWLAQP